jgi:hypothetical protein
MVILSGTVQAWGPRDCPKSDLPPLHLPNVRFLGISINLGPEISHALLGIIENGEVPTGADSVFCEHPMAISSFWSKTGLKSQKVKLFIQDASPAIAAHLLSSLHTCC